MILLTPLQTVETKTMNYSVEVETLVAKAYDCPVKWTYVFVGPSNPREFRRLKKKSASKGLIFLGDENDALKEVRKGFSIFKCRILEDGEELESFFSLVNPFMFPFHLIGKD